MSWWNSLFIFILYVYISITIFYLLLDNRETATTLSWLLVFIFFPFGGIVVYFLVGRGMRKKVGQTLVRQNLEKRMQEIHQTIVEQQKSDMGWIAEKYSLFEHKKLMELLYRNSDSILTRNTDINIFFEGADKFNVLLEDLSSAYSYIHMEYFIWKSDPLSDQVVEVLKQKIDQGVDVRILYDSIGNYLSKRYLKKLRGLGIKIYPYYNFQSPLKIHTLNYRNHRKIVVIDGRIGYIGGMNMGKEYVDGGEQFPAWRDTHMRIKGEAVTVLQEIFSVSWLNTTNEYIDICPVPISNYAGDSLLPVQITTSGPDSKWESIKQLYFLLISSAQKTIFINTPYFIPDASIVMALKTAALSGIDVRIMLTGLLDKRLPYWAALTYVGELLNAGVKIYYYQRGFMHAKTIVVDGGSCSIGTANMDMRSFELNYEINALIYDEALAREMEVRFHADMEDARDFTQEDYTAICRPKQLRNSLARLFAPLL